MWFLLVFKNIFILADLKSLSIKFQFLLTAFFPVYGLFISVYWHVLCFVENGIF